MMLNNTREFWEGAWTSREGRGGARTTHGVSLIGDEETSGKRVLEIGCGDANYRELYAGSSLGYTGIDIALPPLRSIAESRDADGFAQADAVALPFKDGSFDTAISIATFSLLGRSMPDAIAESRRVLVVGGMFVFDAIHTDEMAYADSLSGGHGSIGQSAHGVLFQSPNFPLELIGYDEEGIRLELNERGFGVEESGIVVFTQREFDLLGASLSQRLSVPESPGDEVKSRILVRAIRRE